MILFVGEKRSRRAVRMRVRWEDEALAAIPLFEALRATGIDPTTVRFVNWFEYGKPEIVPAHAGPVVGLGRKVQKALTEAGISHIPLVHPAARGRIRLRANYVEHVRVSLGHLCADEGANPAR